MGCWYHLYEVNNYTQQVNVDADIFGQNWVSKYRVCALGFSYNTSTGECRRIRAVEESSCPVGNPVYPARGYKIELEYDYQSSASRSPLFFARQYASWHFMPYSSSVGGHWIIHVFGRYLTLDTSFIVAVRAVGGAKSFDLSSGNWVARSPTPDILVAFNDGNGSAWRYYDAERQAYEFYDSNGVLLRVQQLNGDSYVLHYSDSNTPSGIAPYPGLLIEIEASSGAAIELSYNSEGRLVEMEDPAGQTYSYAYGDGDSLPEDYLKSVQYPDNSVREYKYETELSSLSYYINDEEPVPLSSAEINALSGYISGVSGSVDDEATIPLENYTALLGENHLRPLTGIIDENGDRYATWEYDTEGRPSVTTHASNADRFDLQYNSNGSVQITNALGGVNTYNYLAQSHRKLLTSISGSPCVNCGCGNGQSMTYNSNGTLWKRYDWNGIQHRYSYDSRGLVTNTTEGYGTSQPRSITTTWHSTLALPTLITESGKTTAFTYDSNGLLTQKTITDTSLGISRTWTYAYTGNGQLYTINGPRTDVSDITTFAYDSAGNISSITNALSQVTQITSYDDHGHPLTIVDPNGLTTTLTYDLRGRLTSRTTGGETTTYTYDNVGQLTRVTLPDDSYLDFTYDEAHRLTGIADRLGNYITYTLDAMGNRLQEDVFDPNDTLTQTRSRVYSTMNRLLEDLGADDQSTEYAYDNNGNLTSSTDPLSHTTGRTYDALNRITQVTDPNSGVTGFTYNARDQLTQVTDARSHSTSYTVDALDNLKQIVSPDTGTTNNTYDAAGNLLTSTDARGAVTTSTYDALNRITQVSSVLSGNTVTTTFTYDTGTYGIGHLTGMSDATSTTSYTYDIKGRLTSKTQTLGSVNLTTRYTYDSDGHLTQMTYPSGKVVSYDYDLQGRIAAIEVDSTTLLEDVAYAPLGGAVGWTWGNSSTYSRPLDEDGRVASYTLGGTATNLTYDDASRITAVGSQSYGYDVLDRLTSYSGIASQAFSYDATGNRTLFTEGANSDTYSIVSTNNRITSISGIHNRSYSYANNGNVTGDSTHTYTYDPRNRLTGVDGTTIYTLNGLGQRIKKTVSSTSTLFIYDEQGRLIGEYDNAGTAINETVYLEDQPVGVLKSSAIYYVHTDHLNTPRAISDTSNTMIWRWDSDPFGTTVANEDPDTNSVTFTYNLRFPGQYYDQESGLSYNYFRDYDPVTGRYNESDPIGLAGGFNTYAYVGNTPLEFIDPLGLTAIPITTPAIPPGGQNTSIGGYDWSAPFWPKWIRDLTDPYRNKEDKSRTQSKPDNCPTDTVPLDKAKKKFGLKGEDHNKIKGRSGTKSGPKDWVGIAPNGDVITTNPDGSAENWGNYKDFLN
ncbi:MAG: RHS repeat protein [Gammaproteobacteria bacterium]|nr:RHS repeat protein [Gammaproteobacteria bacterium]